MAETENAPVFHPFAAGFTDDPYPLYHELRTRSPVLFCPELDCWVATRYEDVSAMLKQPANWSNDQMRCWSGAATLFGGPAEQARCPTARLRSDWMLTVDPPAHGTVREPVKRAFLAPVAGRLRSFVEGLVDELWPVPGAEVDFIEEVAYPLPVRVICHLLGIPENDRGKIAAWAEQSSVLLEGIGSSILPTANEIAAESSAYFRQLFARRSHHSELVDALRAAVVRSEMDEWAAVANAVLLFVAGHETTVNLIANGVWLLASRPELAARVGQEPAQIKACVEEVLRFESPVKFTGRYAVRDASVGGQVIGKGQLVLLGIAAANRDPEQFSDPDSFDPARANNRHLSFGLGIHFCLGAPLARMEAEIVFSRLLRSPLPAPDTARPIWLRSATFRKLQSLPLRFKPC